MIARFVLAIALLFFASPALADEVVVHPEDTGAALVNPMMGWSLFFYSNIPQNYGSRLAPSDTVPDFPGLSNVYLRLPWAYIEPEEGVFDWSIVDAPAQRWIDQGLQVAFRFSCAESWMRFATPEWVKNAGAKGHFCTVGKGVDPDGPLWEPDYNDPVFLEKLDGFLAAAAARYDGNPNVAFIDVGSFGVWGEGHTFASTRLQYPPEVVKKHVDLYAKHFKKTLLAANDDFSFQGEALIEYARAKGMTLRDDSICVQPPPNSWFHAELAQAFWPTLPVILEHEHYGSSKQRGAWGDGSLLLKSVEEYHASYMSIHWWPRIELEENREIIDKINRRMGYRLQLREASFPREVCLGEPFTVETMWANAGVAPCYPGGFVGFALKDDQGGIVAAFADESFDVRDLEVGPPGEAPARKVVSRLTVAEKIYGFAPAAEPGTYDLYVSVGGRDATPVIALPYDDDDGRRRYRIGTMVVLPRAD